MITLSPSQQKVIDEFPGFLMNDEPEMTISGFAGSGKSFLVKYLTDIGEKQQKLIKVIDPSIPRRKMVFTATTNKAAAVLQSMLNREVQTIHSLLELRVKNDYNNGKTFLIPSGEAIQNLHESIIFIDEASMIDSELLRTIREVTGKFKDCKVIFIGDSYQLPPVMDETCPVFTNNKNIFYLKEIQRQAEDSPIIQLSAKYRDMLDDHTLDWPTIANDDPEIIFYDEKLDFFNAVKNAYTVPHKNNDYKIVAWSNNRVRDYNQWIRKITGFTQPFEVAESVITNKPVILNDQVLASTDSMHKITSVTTDQVNGIDGFWITLQKLGNKRMFQPTYWQQADHLANEFRRLKQWKQYFEIKQEWLDLRPIHASTVHKAQGSTYKEVFVDFTDIGRNTHWKEVARLAYVAISRASEKVHIYGQLTMRYNKQPVVDHMGAFKYVDNL